MSPLLSEAAQLGLQVLQHLQRTRTRLLLVGDSMQKQLHGRIVHMFRGSRHPIDNRVFTVSLSWWVTGLTPQTSCACRPSCSRIAFKRRQLVLFHCRWRGTPSAALATAMPLRRREY